MANPLFQTPDASQQNDKRLGERVVDIARRGSFDRATYEPPALQFRYTPHFQWLESLPSQHSDARYKFAIRTCVGCHGQETRDAPTTGVNHITHREHGGRSTLSGFLTGTTHRTRQFHDLYRRYLFLQQAAEVKSPQDIRRLPAIWDSH